MIYDLISSYAVQSVNIGTSGLEVGKPANILTHEWETGLDVFRYHEAVAQCNQSKQDHGQGKNEGYCSKRSVNSASVHDSRVN